METGTILLYVFCFLVGLSGIDWIKGVCLVLIAIIIHTTTANAAQYHTFSYKTADSLKISVRADTREEAFSKASKECFRILTKGVYPGEKLGLDFIDICGNGR